MPEHALDNTVRGITISREYGSGGGEIARRIAAKLNWRLIDHEVVVQIAQALGVSEHEAAVRDEYSDSWIGRVLSNMRAVDPNLFISTTYSTMNTLLMNEEMYHRALANVVHAAYKSGNVVIVGRGSQVLLSEQRDVLHVRVVAPLEMRITYVVQREVMERDQARTRVQQKDRQRSRYLQNLHQRDSNDAHLYDLVLNTAQLSLDDAVYLVCQALKMKEAHLSLPLEQLGPASNHITQYPGTPQDFPSSHSLPNP